MDLNVDSFDRICRACLCESTDMKSLFTKSEMEDQNFLDLFCLAANLSATTEDGLPKQVCSSCELIIHKAHEFRNRCLQSETILINALENFHQEDYFDTNNHDYEVDDKNDIFIDKSSEAHIHEADKKDLDDYPQSFSSEGLNFAMIQPVKKEYENNDFTNVFGNTEPLRIPIEYNLEKVKKSRSKRNKSMCKKTELKNKTLLLNKIDIKSDLACITCNIAFESLGAWQTHQKTHHSEEKKAKIKDKEESDRIFQCTLCFHRLKTKKTLTKHLKRHAITDNIRHKCEKCNREFKYKSYLESHVISVHMHDEFICHICNEKLTSKESLTAHIDTHIDKKKHVCGICNKAFIMLCTLKDHMRKHTGEKPFLCSICGKGFSQKTNMQQHVRRHMGIRPFKCDDCNKGFVSKGELDAHTRKHSGAHPFVCDVCASGFTTSSALIKHRRIHTGERPYACDLCPMRFAASGTLKNHRRTHTGERPFQCSHCEKAFNQRTDLISHIRCHTGERPYICNQCGQAFRKAAALKTHLKMHGNAGNDVLSGLHGGQLSAS